MRAAPADRRRGSSALVHFLWSRTQRNCRSSCGGGGGRENRSAGSWCGRQCCAVNDVRPQLDDLLFSSVDGVSVELVEVTDTDVRVEARTTAGRAACPGCGCWSSRVHGSYLRFPRDLPAVGNSSWCRCGCVGSSVRRRPACGRPLPGKFLGLPAGSAGGPSGCDRLWFRSVSRLRAVPARG